MQTLELEHGNIRIRHQYVGRPIRTRVCTVYGMRLAGDGSRIAEAVVVTDNQSGSELPSLFGHVDFDHDGQCRGILRHFFDAGATTLVHNDVLPGICANWADDDRRPLQSILSVFRFDLSLIL